MPASFIIAIISCVGGGFLLYVAGHAADALESSNTVRLFFDSCYLRCRSSTCVARNNSLDVRWLVYLLLLLKADEPPVSEASFLTRPSKRHITTATRRGQEDGEYWTRGQEDREYWRPVDNDFRHLWLQGSCENRSASMLRVSSCDKAAHRLPPTR